VPVALGHQHTSKASAHRSYAKVFHALSIASILVYWRVWATTIWVNTPSQRTHVWDIFANSISKHSNHANNRFLASLVNTGLKLKHISRHPAISVTSLDVLFTAIALLTWTFTRDLDVHAILESSVLSFLVPNHEKHVKFKKDLAEVMSHADEPSIVEPSSPVEATTPRRRGRPRKESGVNGTSSATHTAPVTGPLRRSTRGKALNGSDDIDSDADPDATYQPSERTQRAVEGMEADGLAGEGDLVHAGESTALAMFLVFFGGLGQLAAGTLGAEVTGPRE
jgi:hypothetical protein